MNLIHLSRLSSDEELLHFARRINTGFLKNGKTEMRKLDSECEAVYLREGAKVVSIVVFYRLEEPGSIEYYIPIAWTHHKHRGEGHFETLLNWLKVYAEKKGAGRISTDVVHNNSGMIRLMEKHWSKTFVRFNLAI